MILAQELVLTILACASVQAAPAPAPAAKAAPAPAAAASAYKNDDERTIYSIGFLMGRNVASFNLNPAEIKLLQSGIADSVGGKTPAVDLAKYQPRINEMLSSRLTAGANKEKERSQPFIGKFLKENKGVVEIPGGGWYLEEKAGTGDKPKATDTIKAHYRGTTIDGVEFDSSYKRGEPTQFGLNQVISCWTNGIGLMKAGGKAKLVCPSNVAYGDAGRPGIKPGATLIFDVELVEVVKAK